MKDISLAGLEATIPAIAGSAFASPASPPIVAVVAVVETWRPLSGPVTLDPRFVAGLKELTDWTQRDMADRSSGSELEAHLRQGLDVLKRLSALTSEIVRDQTAALEDVSEADQPNLPAWKAQLARYSGTSEQLAQLFDVITCRLTRKPGSGGRC